MIHGMSWLTPLAAFLALFLLADVFPGCGGGGPPPRSDTPADSPPEQ